MPAPPKLTDEQRRAALEKAAEARRVRAELKSLIKMGSLTISEVLEKSDSNEIVSRTKVLAVLESMPKIGKVKARRIMKEIGMTLIWKEQVDFLLTLLWALSLQKGLYRKVMNRTIRISLKKIRV